MRSKGPPPRVRLPRRKRVHSSDISNMALMLLLMALNAHLQELRIVGPERQF